ncbi:MAG TPA: hypothetical protein PKX36_05200 [Candidatus Cloacimonadota bacterium]|nr:hypothetical protein [Candidatus Cloacimonadota bacterium]
MLLSWPLELQRGIVSLRLRQFFHKLGRLDFNQYTREINVFDVLLEVQSPVRDRDKRIIYLGALNSKTAKVLFRAISPAIGSI